MSAGVLPSFWQQQLMDEAVLAYVAWRESLRLYGPPTAIGQARPPTRRYVRTRHTRRCSTAKRPPRTCTRAWPSGSASCRRPGFDYTLATRNFA